MKTTTTKTRNLLSIVFGICAFTAMIMNANAESCFLAQQLTDPQVRAEYEQKIGEAKAAAKSRFGATYNYSVSFSPSAHETMTIDSFSYDCVLCHDGMNAKYHEIRYRSEKRQAVSLDTVLGSHPIGMAYGAMAYENAKLRHQTTLPDSMVLVDGRVGCLSCHDLLNPGKKHLVMNNDSNELCMNCHKK